ncbi:MAG: dienelactone hydrolase, partial [Actinomycetota bacterium]|nr:dienelactone hydrolase [Actinomycetota bacterium]
MPTTPAVSGLFLTPGAGSDRDHPSLVALEERLAPLPVERMDFPYRKAGKPFPDRAPILVGAVYDGVAAMATDRG